MSARTNPASQGRTGPPPLPPPRRAAPQPPPAGTAAGAAPNTSLPQGAGALPHNVERAQLQPPTAPSAAPPNPANKRTTKDERDELKQRVTTAFSMEFGKQLPHDLPSSQIGKVMLSFTVQKGDEHVLWWRVDSTSKKVAARADISLAELKKHMNNKIGSHRKKLQQQATTKARAETSAAVLMQMEHDEQTRRVGHQTQQQSLPGAHLVSSNSQPLPPAAPQSIQTGLSSFQLAAGTATTSFATGAPAQSTSGTQPLLSLMQIQPSPLFQSPLLGGPSAGALPAPPSVSARMSTTHAGMATPTMASSTTTGSTSSRASASSTSSKPAGAPTAAPASATKKGPPPLPPRRGQGAAVPSSPPAPPPPTQPVFQNAVPPPPPMVGPPPPAVQPSGGGSAPLGALAVPAPPVIGLPQLHEFDYGHGGPPRQRSYFDSLSPLLDGSVNCGPSELFNMLCQTIQKAKHDDLFSDTEDSMVTELEYRRRRLGLAQAS